jgi:hypothetical protein
MDASQFRDAAKGAIDESKHLEYVNTQLVEVLTVQQLQTTTTH